MNAPGLAVLALLSIALTVWTVMVSRDPKRWRLWWLDIFGILDTDTTRPVRHAQESQVRFMSLVLSLLLILVALSSVFWMFDAVREQRREKSSLERDQEFLKRYIGSGGR
jgi:hypothetical protein